MLWRVRPFASWWNALETGERVAKTIHTKVALPLLELMRMLRACYQLLGKTEEKSLYDCRWTWFTEIIGAQHSIAEFRDEKSECENFAQSSDSDHSHFYDRFNSKIDHKKIEFFEKSTKKRSMYSLINDWSFIDRFHPISRY